MFFFIVFSNIYNSHFDYNIPIHFLTSSNDYQDKLMCTNNYQTCNDTNSTEINNLDSCTPSSVQFNNIQTLDIFFDIIELQKDHNLTLNDTCQPYIIFKIELICEYNIVEC